MKILSAIILSVFLTGCVVYPVQYEPSVVVGTYPIGYWNGYGYWNGVRFDIDFYAPGHYGYGHHYRGYHGGYRHH